MSDQDKNIVIGDLLVKVGLIASADLSEAMQVSRRLGMPMGRVLTMSGNISPEIFQLALEAQSIIRDGVVPPDVGIEALVFAIREKVPMKDAIARIDRHPQFSGTTNRLGELLLDAEIVTQPQLEQALQASMESGLPLGGTLVTQGIIHASLLPTVLRAQEQIRDGIVTRDAAISELRSSMQLWARAEAAMKAAEFAHEGNMGNRPSNVMSTLRDTLESTSGSQSGFPQPANEHLHQHLQQNQQQQSLQHQLQAMQPAQSNLQQFQTQPMQQPVAQQQQQHQQQQLQQPQPQYQQQGYSQTQPTNLQQQTVQPQYQQFQQPPQPASIPQVQQQATQQFSQPAPQYQQSPQPPTHAPAPQPAVAPVHQQQQQVPQAQMPQQQAQAPQSAQAGAPTEPAPAPIYGYNTPYGHAPYGGPAPEDPWGSWHGQVPRAPGLGMPIPAFQPGIAQPPAVPPEGYTPPPGFGQGQSVSTPQARGGDQIPVGDNWNAHQPQPGPHPVQNEQKVAPKSNWAAPQGTKSAPIPQPEAKAPEKVADIKPAAEKPAEHHEGMGDQIKSAAAQLASRLGWTKPSDAPVAQDADLPAPKKLSWMQSSQKAKVEDEKSAEPVSSELSIEEQKASLQQAASLDFGDEPGTDEVEPTVSANLASSETSAEVALPDTSSDTSVEDKARDESAAQVVDQSSEQSSDLSDALSDDQTDAEVKNAFEALDIAEVLVAQSSDASDAIEENAPDADPIVVAVVDEPVAETPAESQAESKAIEEALPESVAADSNSATASGVTVDKPKGIAGFEKGTRIHLKSDYSPNETGRLFSISHDEALIIRAEENTAHTAPLTDKKPEKGKKGKGKNKGSNAASQSQSKLAQQPAKGKKGQAAAAKSHVGLPSVVKESDAVQPWSPLKSQAHPATQFGKRGGGGNIPDFLEDLVAEAPAMNAASASQTKIKAVSQRATSLSVSNLLPVPIDALEAQAELAMIVQSHGAPLPMPQLPFYTPATYPETPATIVELLTMGGFFTRKDIANALDKALEDASLAPDLLLALGLVAEDTLDVVLRCQAMTRNRELTSEQAMYVLGAVRSGRLTFDAALQEIGKK